MWLFEGAGARWRPADCASYRSSDDDRLEVIDTGHPHRAIPKLLQPHLEVVGLAVKR
jgi:hypothetical protein